MMVIALYEGFVAILTEQLNVETHSHNALQIALSVDGQILRCETANGAIKGEVLLIPPLQPHSFQGVMGSVLVLLVDDESVISEAHQHQSIHPLNPRDFLELQTYFRQHISSQPSSQPRAERKLELEAERIREMLLRIDVLRGLSGSTVDERIQNLIRKVKTEEDFTPSAAEAAQLCYLSESRFLHLFKEELGLPFRKYLQWIKLRRAMKSLKSSHSLTAAAHSGGFSDSSHLSRFFTESFGLNPSEALKNSQFMQVD